MDSPAAARVVYCIAEGVYPHLTYGSCYQVLAADQDKETLRLVDDNKRARWYPKGQFATDKPPELSRIELAYLECEGLAEATLHFDDGSRRWTHIATPARLAYVLTREAKACLAIPHLVVLHRVDEESVREALSNLMRQGELQACTLPC